jgi:hypothetical protein
VSDIKHTAEPWRFYDWSDGSVSIHDSHDDRIANMVDDFDEANARRIVACVNACAGIPINMLAQVGLGAVLTIGRTNE